MELLGIFAASDEAGSQGIGALGIDPIQLLIQTATFLLLLWLVKKYALGSVVEKLEKRHTDINRGLHLTAELDKQKAELDERVERVMKEARKSADVVIAEAHTDSGSIVKAAEKSAQRKADGILKEAEGRIEREITEARKDLKLEMTNLVVDATEAILNQKIDGDKDRKLVEEYLKGAMK